MTQSYGLKAVSYILNSAIVIATYTYIGPNALFTKFLNGRNEVAAYKV